MKPSQYSRAVQITEFNWLEVTYQLGLCPVAEHTAKRDLLFRKYHRGNPWEPTIEVMELATWPV